MSLSSLDAAKQAARQALAVAGDKYKLATATLTRAETQVRRRGRGGVGGGPPLSSAHWVFGVRVSLASPPLPPSPAASEVVWAGAVAWGTGEERSGGGAFADRFHPR